MDHLLEWDEFSDLTPEKLTEKINNLSEAIEEEDLEKPFGVFLAGGSLGSRDHCYVDRKNRKLIKTFDDEAEAKEYAQRNNKQLTPGEKGYYKMKYSAAKIEKSALKKNAKLESEDVSSLDEGASRGWPILPIGKINLVTGDNEYFNFTQENGSFVLVTVENKFKVIYSSGTMNVDDLIDKYQTLSHDQTGRRIGEAKVVGTYKCPYQLKELQDKIGSKTVSGYVFK